MKNRRLVLVVAVLFTAVAAVGFCVSVAAIATSLSYRPTVESAGSGGIGFVSASISFPILATLLFVAAALFLNVSLAQYARARGRAAMRLRRVHLAATLLTLVWPGLVLLLFVLLDQSSLLDQFAIIAAGAAFVSAVHGAIGILAISAGSSPSPQRPLS